jgi:cell division protein FtsZ
VVQTPAAQPALRTGTDGLPILNHVAQQPMNVSGAAGQPQHDYSNLSTPSVWRSARTQAAAKVEALSSNGMDEIEIPAFLRKQAD